MLQKNVSIGHPKVKVLVIKNLSKSYSRIIIKQDYYRSHPKDEEGNIFSLFTTGEGVPHSQVLSLVSCPRFFPGGVPQSWPGSTPVSVPDSGGRGGPGDPSPSHRWGTPRMEQQNEHLLRRGQCASCVHAGGFSCIS